MGRRNRLLRSALAPAVALVALCLGAAPSEAATLSMWLAPQAGFGAASVVDAQAAGVGFIPDDSFFAGSASTLTITTPTSIFGSNLKKASLRDPSRGSSIWTVRALDRDYQKLWIVIQGHDPNDANASYYTDNTKIGLVIDPTDRRWWLVHPTGAPQVTYLAYFVGDLAQGASFEVPISYAIAQALRRVSGDRMLFMFPQYRVNFLQVSLPEPALLSLLAFAGLGLAMRRRRIAE